MTGFSFGEKSTWDFSMHVEKIPALMGPTRKRKVYSVAGRNGDLHIDEGAYSNYQQPYECYFHNSRPTPELAHEIRAWLYGDGSCQRLTDSYDPTHFRLATFAGPLDIENHLNKYGRCTVYFDCAPQSFLLSGEDAVVIQTAKVVHNPTTEVALPLIAVYGTGSGMVTIGDISIEILEMDERLIIDCDTENAYILLEDGAREFKNTCISSDQFPKLYPGNNGVSYTGNITKIEIIPRWWET